MKRVTVGSTLVTLLTACAIIIFLSAKHCDECFSAPVLAIKFFVSGMIILIGSIYFTRLYLKTEKIVFNIETVPLLDTNEAASDVPFSCEGTILVDPDHVLTSPYTHTPCVYYHSITEEYRGSGKNARWVIIDNFIAFVPFYISDRRGKLLVDVTNIDNDFSSYTIENKKKEIPDPDCSEIDCRAALLHDEFSGEKRVFGLFTTRPKQRRSEYVLMPETKVFVYGYVSKINGELVLHESPDHPLLISEKTKEKYINEFYKGSNLIFVMHFLFSLGFTVALLAMDYFIQVPIPLLWTSLAVGNAAITGSIVFTMYNRIITLKERAAVAISNIDIELKRRSELIPAIVALVKEYTGYEKNIFETITALRVQMTQEQTVIANASKAEPKLLAILEQYPKLKTVKNYEQLMNALVDAEERIAYSRSFYNRNVRKLNTLITQFPFVLIAYFFDIKTMNYLSIIESNS